MSKPSENEIKPEETIYDRIRREQAEKNKPKSSGKTLEERLNMEQRRR